PLARERSVDRGEQRVDAGVLGFHLFQQGEVAGPVRHLALETGPQPDVLDAVVDEELGLEVLPARLDTGGASFPGGRGRLEPDEVPPEGVGGRVYFGKR